MPQSKLDQQLQHAIQLQQSGRLPAFKAAISLKPFNDYLNCYNQIDIALDPFPFAGGTITCDALWMGVPVITLAGDAPVSRGGVSILHNIGLEELIADTTDQYIQIALSLVHDISRLQKLRASLRQKIRSSRLMDEPQCTSDLENVLREMWVQWCGAR